MFSGKCLKSRSDTGAHHIDFVDELIGGLSIICHSPPVLRPALFQDQSLLMDLRVNQCTEFDDELHPYPAGTRILLFFSLTSIRQAL